MDKSDWFAFGMLVGGILMILMFILVNDGTYKDGYIDAMNDKEVYELQIDTTTTIDSTWVKNE